MSNAPIAIPLLRLGRLELGPGLRALRLDPAASDLVVTATVELSLIHISEPTRPY